MVTFLPLPGTTMGPANKNHHTHSAENTGKNLAHAAEIQQQFVVMKNYKQTG